MLPEWIGYLYVLNLDVHLAQMKVAFFCGLFFFEIRANIVRSSVLVNARMNNL